MSLLENKLIVANTGSDSLTIVDLETHRVTNTIYLSALSNSNKVKSTVLDGPYIGPHQVIFGEDNRLYSVNSYDNSVYRINMYSNKIEDAVLVGSFPSHIETDNGRIFVTNSDSNSISIIDEKEFRIIENIPVGEKPHDIKISRNNNTVYIANNNGHSINIIDLNQNIEQQINLKYNPLHISINDETMVILCPLSNGMVCSKILVWDFANKEIIRDIEIAGVIFDMTISEDDNMIYVTNAEDGCIYEVNTNHGKIISRHYIGGMPNNIIMNNSKIFISDVLENKITIFDCKYHKIIDSIKVGLEPCGMIVI